MRRVDPCPIIQLAFQRFIMLIHTTLRWSRPAALLLAISMLATGCTSPTTRTDKKLNQFFQTPDWVKNASWSKDEKTPPEPYPGPVKLAVTWTPDVLVQTGRTPTRGFGGRLFFFDEKSKAVPVEGTLTVHGFAGGVSEKDAKVRPFKFTPEQFTQHFSQSDFGASYSIWIPWDAAGGDQTRVSLVVTFQSTSGKLVQGTPTTVILPGRTQKQEMAQVASMLSPQYTGHKDAISQRATLPSGLATTTIRRRPNPGAKNIIPASTIAKKVEAIAASQRLTAPNGKTPFADVQLTKPDSPVMTASAEMESRTAPRRIKMPVR